MTPAILGGVGLRFDKNPCAPWDWEDLPIHEYHKFKKSTIHVGKYTNRPMDPANGIYIYLQEVHPPVNPKLYLSR